MDLNNVFGGFDQRPESPDFWRLSEIILRLDGMIAEAKDEDERNRLYNENVERWVDGDSLFYLALQRGMRALGITKVGEVRQNAPLLTRMAILYAEGFQVGTEYAHKHGEKN